MKKVVESISQALNTNSKKTPEIVLSIDRKEKSVIEESITRHLKKIGIKEEDYSTAIRILDKKQNLKILFILYRFIKIQEELVDLKKEWQKYCHKI